jgi:exodeoxyribonuclease-3
MKIATWNVNSIRARADHVKKWLERASPDVLCLQELKTPADEFPADLFREAGYDFSLCAQKTYNGVAILSRSPLAEVREGLAHLPAGHPLNAQKRVLSAAVGPVRVISVYMPNGEEVGSDKYAYKLDFYREFRNYLDAFHTPAELLCVCGDFNVAPEDRDVYNSAERNGGIFCSLKEREALSRVEGFGLADLYRLHSEETGKYTWWDYRGAMYWKGLGIRLDLMLATRTLANSCRECVIDESPRKWKKPSDHTVVWASFDL